MQSAIIHATLAGLLVPPSIAEGLVEDELADVCFDPAIALDQKINNAFQDSGDAPTDSRAS